MWLQLFIVSNLPRQEAATTMSPRFGGGGATEM